MSNTSKKNSKNGTSRKPIKKLTLKQVLQKKESLTSGDSDELHLNVGRSCAHHDMMWVDGDDKKLYTIGTKLPPLLTSYILRAIDKDSKRQSFKTWVDIYGNWPLGKNRGEDPIGDELMDYLNAMHDAYCNGLDQKESEAIKKSIFIETKQTAQPGVKISTPTRERLRSPVIWEVYPSDHDQAGEIDPNKSPNFKVMLWDQDIGPDTFIAPDDLVVDNGQKKIRTAVYDRTKDFHTAKKITTEAAFENVLYTAGDFAKGRFPFKLLQQIDLLNPKVYWQKDKMGEWQIKATSMDVTEKITGENSREKTPEELIQLQRDTLAAQSYYNLGKRQIVVTEPSDGDGSDGPNKSVKTEAGQSASGASSNNTNDGNMLTREEEEEKERYERDVEEAQKQLPGKPTFGKKI